MSTRRGVMVGREAELNLLLDAFVAAEAGEPQVAVVLGEAGIGKTRLVREFVGQLPESTIVSVGHAVPLAGGEIPYGAVSDLLLSLVDQVGSDAVKSALDGRAKTLGPLVPRLAEGHPGAVDRLALLGATRELIQDLGRDRTVVLVVEDAHWTDESSLDVLSYWARTLVHGRVLLVVTGRDSGIEESTLQQLGQLRRLPNATAAHLRGLDAMGVEAQVRALAPGITPAALARIVTLSDGVPLYVEELVSAGTGEGAFSHSDLVRLDLTSRLSALDASAIEVLQCAALEARPFAPTVLHRVTGRDLPTVDHALEAAYTEGLLDRVPDDRWRFHHELLRRAAAETLAPSVRARAHRAWADTLGADPHAKVGDLIAAADHREALGPSEDALAARVRAARASRDVASGAESSGQWLRALAMLHLDPSLAMEELHEEVLSGACDGVDGPQGLLRVIEAEELAAPSSAGVRRTWLRLARYATSRNLADVPAPRPTAEELAGYLDQLRREPARPLVADTLDLLTGAFHAGGMGAERDCCIDCLAAMMQRLPGHLSARVMEWRLVSALDRGPDNFDELAGIILDALSGSDELSSADRSFLHSRASWVLLNQGDLGQALAHARTATRLAQGPDAARVAWHIGAVTTLDLLWHLGGWNEALELAPTLTRDPDLPESVNTALAVEALVHASRGEPDRVRDAASAVLAPLGTNQAGITGYFTRFFQPLIAALALERPDPAAARESLTPFLRAPDVGQHGMAGDFLVVAARLAGADTGYDALLVEAAGRTFGQSTWDRAFSAHVHAYLARGGDAPAAWADVASAWERLEVPRYAAEGRLRLAQALVAIDDLPGAGQAVSRSLTVAEGLGARVLADEARTLAARARLSVKGQEPATAGSHGLTAREQEVLQLLATGLTNQQIAEALFMSPRTASVHVSRIIAKLGAANRTEVSAIAHRQGLLSN